MINLEMKPSYISCHGWNVVTEQSSSQVLFWHALRLSGPIGPRRWVQAPAGWLRLAPTLLHPLSAICQVGSYRTAKIGARKINGNAFCLQKLIFILVFGLNVVERDLGIARHTFCAMTADKPELSV